MAKKRKAEIVIEPPVKAAPSAQRVLKKSAAKKSSKDKVETVEQLPNTPSRISFQPQMTDKRIFDIWQRMIRRNAKLDRWMPEPVKEQTMARKSKTLKVELPPVKPVASVSKSHAKSTNKKSTSTADTSTTADEQKEVPPWTYFKPQITDKDIFDSLKKTMKRNAKKDRWMLEE